MKLWTGGSEHSVKIFTFSGTKGTEVENMNTGTTAAKSKILKEAVN